MNKTQKSKGGKSPNSNRRSTSKMKNNDFMNRQDKGSNPTSQNKSTYGSDSYNANDPSWYVPNEQLLNDVASLPYSIPLGSSIDLGLPTVDDDTGLQARHVPGVLAFHMYAGPGRSNSIPEAINVAANMIYSKIRANISGSRPYDAPDVMMYLMGADNAYMYLSWMQRLYGIMNVYSSVNRYLPKALIETQGVDFDNLRNNLSSFRYYINNFALQLASLYVPADLPIFKRHYWLYQNVWTDSESAMSQLYMYVPAGFGTYEEKTSEKGGIIKFNGSYGYGRSSKWNLGAIAGFGDLLLQKLIYSEDVGTISGDIRRTYGEGHSLVPSTIDETYSVIPSYNREVLSQVENTFALGVKSGVAEIKSLDIKQDPATNKLAWDLTFTRAVTKESTYMEELYSLADAYYLSSHGNATTPADNIVMTRFMNASFFISGQDIQISSCGSEIVLDISIATLDADSVELKFIPNYVSDADINSVIAISKFDWHPVLYVFDTKVNSQGNYNFHGIVADLDTFTLLPKQQLVRLNDMACMGLFNVPYRG